MKSIIKECFNCKKIYDYFPRIDYKGKNKIYCIACMDLHWHYRKKPEDKEKSEWKPKLTSYFHRNSKKQS